MQRDSKHWFLVLIIAIPALVYAGARIFYTTVEVFSLTRSLGLELELTSNRIVNVDKDSEAEKSGIKKGDALLAVDGFNLSGLQVRRYLYKRDPSGFVMCTVAKASDEQKTDILLPIKTRRHGLIELTFLIIGGILFPLIYVPIGLAVLVLRPKDSTAILFCFLFLSLPSFFGGDYVRWPSGLHEFGIICKDLLSSFMFCLFYWFFSTFPAPSAIEKRAPWLKYFFLLCAGLMGTFGTFLDLGLQNATQSAKVITDFATRANWLPKVIVAYFFSSIVLGLVSLVLNTMKAPTAADRRRLRIIMWGALVSFVPITIVFLVFAFAAGGGHLKTNSWLVPVLLLVTFSALLIFPILFAYAIIKHKVIPVSLIVRRGLQYALVSRAFIALEALLLMMILGFVWFGAGGFLSRLDPRLLFVILPIGGIGVYTFLSKVNRKTMPIIDRKFFRGAYNAQQILTQMGQRIASVIKLDELFRLMALQIAKAFHVENVAVFLKTDQEAFQCFRYYHFDSSARLTSADHTDNHLSFGDQSPLIKRLKDGRYPVYFNFAGRDYFLNSLKENHPLDYEMLQALHSHCKASSEHLLVPLLTKEQIIGFISLSEKLSEEPFTKEDKDLLNSVASQVSIAVANSKLAEEVIKQEQLRKELEIAKEVQVQLFPQNPPRIGTLDYSGICLPARGVGGDYYDFLELGKGNLSIALADVSGKGIAAALLMANLQASLRSHAPIFTTYISGLIETVNRLTTRSTGGNKYATVFYSIYEGASQTLTYVNAGHNPPLLFRSTEITALETGGPVVGLLPDGHYEEAMIRLRARDLLVAYTDGITEAFNPKEEEFGLSRLIDLIQKNRTLSAIELQNLVMDTVLEFSQGAEQHDDMTIIIAKIL